MQKQTLQGALGLEFPAIVAFYGAGGKTTLLKKLASELKSARQKIIITTTTKIYKPPGKIILQNTSPEQTAKKIATHLKDNDVAILGSAVLPGGKVAGVDPYLIDFLYQHLKYTILVEADGAKGKSLKGYDYYEPVIPEHSHYIIPILGGDALGKALTTENTHRLELFSKSTGIRESEKITVKTMADAFCHMLDLGKKQAPRALACLVINKADQISSPGKVALKIASLIGNTLNDIIPGKLLITEGQKTDPVKIVLNFTNKTAKAKIACVVLAAGQSSRMGQAKLALRVKEKTILEITLGEIIAAGIEKIILVVAPGWKESLECSKLKQHGNIVLEIVENPLYQTGMASSLKAGLKAVDPDTQGILFALADQPSIPAAVYRTLCENYQQRLALVTSPVYKEQRGNPVLFDRRTWPELMKVSGDEGGKTVLKSINAKQRDNVEVDTPAVLRDIDTPEDYLAYLNSLET